MTYGPYPTDIGSRVYFLNSEDKYTMFHLKKSMTVTSSVALYFVATEKDGGASRHGNAGAKYGTGYCDVQCPHDLKWFNGEANVDN